MSRVLKLSRWAVVVTCTVLWAFACTLPAPDFGELAPDPNATGGKDGSGGITGSSGSGQPGGADGSGGKATGGKTGSGGQTSTGGAAGTSSGGFAGAETGGTNSGGTNSGGTGGTGGGNSGGTGGQNQTCGGNLTFCGDGCWDTQNEEQYCGNCDTKCGVGQICSAGKCVCTGGKTWCGDRCAYLPNDEDHCGKCDSPCATGKACSAGSCSCNEGEAKCGDACIDILHDDNNCGECDKACPTGLFCIEGTCKCPGDTEQVCGDTCVDTQTSAAHCGRCNNPCGAGQTCVAGACKCTNATLSACGGACVNLQTDDANCGGCTRACAADRSCAAGSCACDSPKTDCNGTCVNMATDTANCGTCGKVCSIQGQVCRSSVCECGTGLSQCPPKPADPLACVNLQTDGNNCGACGTKCGAGQSCVAGKCECTAAGLTKCGSVCVDTKSNPSHCGGCGITCGVNTACNNGSCVSTCAGSTPTLCGGACVNTTNNVLHCGGCNKPCDLPNVATETCVASACGIGACAAGWVHINSSIADGCEYACTPTVPNTEVCNDGKDNNCDGSVDCVSVVSSFPQPDGAAANEDVQLKIAAPAFAAGTYAVQCAVKRPATIGAVADNEWVACAGFDSTTLVVKPPLPNPAEGKWAVRIRLKFTSGPFNGRASAPSPAFPYYLHNSMAGASLSPCVPKATDAAFFAEAKKYFMDASLPKFIPSGASKDTFLANPWIRVRFTPPVTNRMSFASYSSPVDVDMVSLRRRFALDASNELLLVTRNYPSRVAQASYGWANHCEVGIIRKHDSDIGDEAFQSSTREFWNRCDAWVLNRAGAGVCLRVVGTSVVAQNASSKTFVTLLTSLGITWPSADNWMWRKLQRNDGLFSRKCWTVDCNKTDPSVLFLPDRALPGAGFP